MNIGKSVLTKLVMALIVICANQQRMVRGTPRSKIKERWRTNHQQPQPRHAKSYRRANYQKARRVTTVLRHASIKHGGRVRHTLREMPVLKTDI
jgi:hypothetical protein